MDLGTGKKISAIGVSLGVVIGVLGGSYLASKMTRTPANKRILYSGLIQIGAGWLFRNRWPGLALGMIGSGVVNVVSVAMTARADALLDGSRFVPATTTLPAAEARTQLLNAPAAIESTTAPYRRAAA